MHATIAKHADDRLKAFAYVQAEKAFFYRAVVRVFVTAKERFVLHLRPEEITTALRQRRPALSVNDEEVIAALQQLCDWGNLEDHPDTADVATVEEFYRQRNLYQLTAAGEAAERAVVLFHEILRQPGELQTAALSDIRALLEELLGLTRASELDAGKAHRVLLALRHRFEELTARAQAFVGSLQRTIDLHGVEVDSFLSYKEMLIDYLERFIGELVMATSAIAALLRDLEKSDVGRLLLAAARRDLSDALDPSADDHARALDAWRGRWQGLRSWFLGDGRSSQAEILRSRARAAIPALLSAAQEIHDRRTQRSDRTSDLRTLARWFAETDREEDAHRLWRAAFALSPARHLTIDSDTLEAREAAPQSAQTSWFEAPLCRCRRGCVRPDATVAEAAPRK